MLIKIYKDIELGENRVKGSEFNFVRFAFSRTEITNLQQYKYIITLYIIFIVCKKSRSWCLHMSHRCDIETFSSSQDYIVGPSPPSPHKFVRGGCRFSFNNRPGGFKNAVSFRL